LVFRKFASPLNHTNDVLSDKTMGESRGLEFSLAPFVLLSLRRANAAASAVAFLVLAVVLAVVLAPVSAVVFATATVAGDTSRQGETQTRLEAEYAVFDGRLRYDLYSEFKLQPNHYLRQLCALSTPATRRKTEHLVLTGPFHGQVGEASNTHAIGIAFRGSAHRQRRISANAAHNS
jgi:hypothetical protein